MAAFPAVRFEAAKLPAREAVAISSTLRGLGADVALAFVPKTADREMGLIIDGG